MPGPSIAEWRKNQGRGGGAGPAGGTPEETRLRQPDAISDKDEPTIPYPTTMRDMLQEALPELAGALTMAIPGGALTRYGLKPAASWLATKGGPPAIAEVLRELLAGEQVNPEEVALRAGLNLAPEGMGAGVKAGVKSLGGGLVRRSLAKGMESPGTATTVAHAVRGQGALPAASDVDRMAETAIREGASMRGVKGATGPTGLPDSTPADSYKFNDIASQIDRLSQLKGGAAAMYARNRPDMAATLQRAGGNSAGASEELRALSGVLAKAKQAGKTSGVGTGTALRGLGIGVPIGLATGSPLLGTAAGLSLGAVEASPQLKFAAGQGLSKLARRKIDKGVEGVARAGLVGATASTAKPRRRKAEKEE